MVWDLQALAMSKHRSYANGWEIYSLIDPSTNEIRYIGVTRDSNERLWFHIRFAGKRDTPVRQWVDDLLMQDKSPIMKVIEKGKGHSYYFKERDLITQLRSEGVRLLNVLSGGTGRQATKPVSDETRAKVAAASREAWKGRKLSDENKQKMIEGRRRYLAQRKTQ